MLRTISSEFKILSISSTTQHANIPINLDKMSSNDDIETIIHQLKQNHLELAAGHAKSSSMIKLAAAGSCLEEVEDRDKLERQARRIIKYRHFCEQKERDTNADHLYNRTESNEDT